MKTYYESNLENAEFVSLTDSEIDAAIKHGLKMRRTSIARGHRNNPGYDPDDEKANRVQALGSVCETAVAKALGFSLTLR